MENVVQGTGVSQDAADDVVLYDHAKTNRSGHDNEWKMAAAYCLPAHYSAWQTDGPANTNMTNGMSASRRVQFDSTGARSLPKYMAILERLATPAGMKWHGLTASDDYLRKKYRVRSYFDQLQNLLFKYRNMPRAGFRTASNEVYMSMGVYGNGPIYIGQARKSPLYNAPSFRYNACPMRDVFFIVNDEGEVVGVFRRFWLNPRQFKEKFPGVPMPKSLQNSQGSQGKGENSYEEFVHYVHIRGNDYDPSAIDNRRHPIVGKYICVKDRTYIGEHSGYRSFPYKIPRTLTVSGDPYGYSPAVTALASLGGASTIKKTNLKQGNKAADPVLLTHDDGVLSNEIDQRPGAVNPGGINAQGKRLIDVLPTGDYRVAEALLQDERTDIEDCFFVTLFQILTETPEMTATEVVERVAEKTALLSPTMGRLQSEFLGPTIEREIDLLTEMGVMPPMPPELIEARGEYDIVYTSPMAKGMYAEEVSGFMRTTELALNLATASGNPEPLDHFDFDTALPEIADYQAVPTRWMNDPDKVKQVRDRRAEQAEQQQLIENAPGLAGAAKVASDIQKGTGK